MRIKLQDREAGEVRNDTNVLTIYVQLKPFLSYLNAKQVGGTNEDNFFSSVGGNGGRRAISVTLISYYHRQTLRVRRLGSWIAMEKFIRSPISLWTSSRYIWHGFLSSCGAFLVSCILPQTNLTCQETLIVNSVGKVYLLTPFFTAGPRAHTFDKGSELS